jgi:2-polyprenyl-3-methyl-5-hydroxy-6-metoxy-1,4-benzoquinol methylase
MNLSAEFFRLLGDPQRLRILRLLSLEKLNVSELTEILGTAQSGISRHLRLLREAELVREDRERGWSYYFVDARQFSNGIAGLWPSLKDQLKTLDGVREDDVRLQEVLRQRKEDFREQPFRTVSPGRSWAAWARTMSYVAPHCVVADLGCGEGYLTLEVARWAKKVIAIDKSKPMLQRAKQLARKHGMRNIRWKQARIEKLPLQDQSVDLVLMAQVLHALQNPSIGLAEAHRILKPGGKLLLQDLRTHQEEWVKSKLGDVWFGFEEKELRVFLKNARFVGIKLDVGSRRRGDPFTVLIGCGMKRKNA